LLFIFVVELFCLMCDKVDVLHNELVETYVVRNTRAAAAAAA